MTRLLVISNNPDRASFRQRIGLHLPLLEDRGVQCRVASFPGQPWARSRLLAESAQFDGVLLHRKMLNAWDGFWLRRSTRRVIYDFDDAIMYSDRDPERVSRLRFRRFGRSAALSHLVIAGNPYLADHARRYNANVCILPTSLDLEPYRTPLQPQTDGKIRLVWIGSKVTLKYLREITPALEEVASLCKNVVLRIVCNEFFDLASMPVEKRTWSNETEAADLMTSDIGLAPLPNDAFTRGKCGFKILQYQAAGLPAVASPVGVNAQFVSEGESGFLAGDIAAWVRGLCVLVQDAVLRKKMGLTGKRHAEAFDRKVIGKRFCQLVVSGLGGQQA